jgi:hypothetical protein
MTASATPENYTTLTDATLEAAGEFTAIYVANIQTRLEEETARFKSLPQSEPPNAGFANG